MSLRVSTVTQSHFQAFPRVIFYVLRLCDWRMSHSRLYFLLIRNTEPRVWFSWKHRISCAYWSNDSNVEQNNDKSRCNIRCLGRDSSNHEIWFDSSLFVVSSFHHLFFFFLTRDRLRVDIKRFPVPLPFVCSEIREKKEEKVESRQDWNLLSIDQRVYAVERGLDLRDKQNEREWEKLKEEEGTLFWSTDSIGGRKELNEGNPVFYPSQSPFSKNDTKRRTGLGMNKQEMGTTLMLREREEKRRHQMQEGHTFDRLPHKFLYPRQRLRLSVIQEFQLLYRDVCLTHQLLCVCPSFSPDAGSYTLEKIIHPLLCLSSPSILIWEAHTRLCIFLSFLCSCRSLSLCLCFALNLLLL